MHGGRCCGARRYTCSATESPGSMTESGRWTGGNIIVGCRMDIMRSGDHTGAAQRVLQIAAWAAILAIFVMTDGPMLLRPVTGGSPDGERFLAYAVAGALFALAYPNRPWLVLGFLVAAAGSFELLQMLAPGRHSHLTDFGWKSAGAVFGALAGFSGRKIASLYGR